MENILIGVVVGLFTSLIAGMVLIWKGQDIVEQMKLAPTRRRIDTFSRAYIRALRAYPHTFGHYLTLQLFAAGWGLLITAYIAASYQAFLIYTGSVGTRVDVLSQVATARENTFGVIGLVTLAMTVSITVAFAKFVRRTMRSMLLVPYAHRELSRLRECVARYATPEEFLRYTDVEYRVNTREGLVDLFNLANHLLGGVKFGLLEELKAGISEPGQQVVRAGASDAKQLSGSNSES